MAVAMSEIPTVDLSPFFSEGNNEEEKKKVMEVIREACSEYGFFQVVNAGVPAELLNRALELTRAFFAYPLEEKLKFESRTKSLYPVGYNRFLKSSQEENESFLVFSPESNVNVYPQNPPQYKEVLEDLFWHLAKASSVVENILSDCLGLPPNFLSEYNDNRSGDFMLAHNYFPATETNDLGLSEHEDGGVVTFVFQDGVGGLQVFKDGTWIPVVPQKDTLVVNVGDVIQVMSNNKFKSATHRVVRPKGTNRCSYTFFRSLHGNKWVEPLQQFTSEIGESPKYKGFKFMDYTKLRLGNKTNPHLRPEDVFHISHYAINN